MAGCYIDNNIENNCEVDVNYGGIKKIVIFEYSGITGTPVADNYELTELVLDAAFEAYTLDTALFTSTWISPQVGGTRTTTGSFTPTLTMVFPKNRLSLIQSVTNIVKARSVVIIQDRNNQYFCLGLENGMYSAPGAAASVGTLQSDDNTYTLVLMGDEKVAALSTDISLGSGIDDKILTKFGFGA